MWNVEVRGLLWLPVRVSYTKGWGCTLSPDTPSFHLSAPFGTRTASLACIVHTAGLAPFFLSTHTSQVCLRQSRETWPPPPALGGPLPWGLAPAVGSHPFPAPEACPVPEEGSLGGEPGHGWALEPGVRGRKRPWGAPPPPNRGSPPGVGVQRVPLPPRPRRPPQASRKHPSSVLPFVFSPPPSPQGRPAAGWSRPGGLAHAHPGPAGPRLEERSPSLGGLTRPRARPRLRGTRPGRPI